MPNWMEDDLGLMKGRYIVLIGVLAVALFIGGTFGVCEWVNENECGYKGQQYGHATKYHWVYGCFIQVDDGHWLNIENYQGYKVVH